MANATSRTTLLDNGDFSLHAQIAPVSSPWAATPSPSPASAKSRATRTKSMCASLHASIAQGCKICKT